MGRVVITGIGVVSPIGIGESEFAKNLFELKTGISEISLFNIKSHNCNLAGQIKKIDFGYYLRRNNSKYLSRETKFLLVAAHLGLKNSGVKIEDHDSLRTGVVVGCSFDGIPHPVEFIRTNLIQGPEKVSPMAFPQTLSNFPAGQVARIYGIKGVNSTLASGFASGLDAIGYSFELVKRNRRDLIVCGGAEAFNLDRYKRFLRLGFLPVVEKVKKGSGEKKYKARNNMILGEGSAVLILENKQSLQGKGKKAFAEIVGWGRAFGVNVRGVSLAMNKALQDAGISPEEIKLVYVNANGLRKIDKIEEKAILKVYKDRKGLLMTSIKPLVGESCSVGGVMQTVAACLSIKYKRFPCKYSLSVNRLEKREISNEDRKREYVMVNSFDPFGNNSSIILRHI